MSDRENIDLGKVIGLIMENPALIEQISSLARQSNLENKVEESNKVVEETVAAPESEPPKSTPTSSPSINHNSNRARLLGALKPYVSEERAKAIDSMISIANILDMMKAR